MKKILIILLTVLLTSCAKQEEMKYERELYGIFDTVTTLTFYVEDKDDFDRYYNYCLDRLNYFNKLFDIYKNYDINNLKTINDNRGIKEVTVDYEIIDLIEKSKDMYFETKGNLDISMGNVLNIWHNYRIEGKKIPDMNLLEDNNNSSIDDIVIDKNKNTVFIKSENTSIDLGSVAKGYCADILAKELKEMGLKRGIINLGGNIITIGDNLGMGYKIGVQNPDKNDIDQIIDTVVIRNESIVSSGGYERFYEVDNKKYSHIINPVTLMPADNYLSVTVICDSSFIADALTTTLFITPIDEGKKLAEKYDAKVIYIKKDKSIEKFGF